MQRLILIYSLIVLSFLPFRADGQAEDPCHYSTEGKDFWFGIMQNRITGAEHYLEITVTSRIGAQFTVTYGPTETLIGNYSVAANSSQTVPIDYRLIEAAGSETIETKGVHLVATNPVNVYALNYRTRSSDVAVIYPTEALGKEYYAMCYTPHLNGTTETNSEFMIVATVDNTNLKITPSVNTDLGNLANTTITISLNKGQSYQVQSMNSNVAGQGDLTGSYVTSSKSIAFFSGSKATSVPLAGSSYDFLYEQIPPTSAWGREFYVVPLRSRTKDTYRVLASEDGTIVKVDEINLVRTINRGQFFEFELTSSQASRIMSSKKVLVAQYCRSQAVDGSSGVGDPFMIILSPVTQKINDVTFVAYESALIQNIFFINIITLTSEVVNMTLDGSNIGFYFNTFPNNEYSYAQIPTSKGPHRLRDTHESGGFLAFIYGFGSNGNTESYGYGVGFNLDIQLDIVGNWTSETPVVCQGKETKLAVGDYFDSYRWSTGDTLPYIMVSKEGMYKITAMNSRGCGKSDSVFVKLNDPKMDLGNDTSSCGPGKIVLQAGKDFKSYLWQDGSTEQSFRVDNTGDYLVTGTNAFGCQASDTVHADVFQVPEVKLIGDTLFCGIFSSTLKVKVTNADSVLWNYPGAAKWTSTPEGLEFENIKQNGVTLKANKPGYYQINYTLTTKEGCQVMQLFKVGFYEIPESDFDVYTPESTDKCSSYERIVKYTGKNGASANYNWDFGGLMVLDTVAPNHFKVSIGANKPNRTIKLLVEDHGCTSPITTISIGVTPTFQYWADKVHGCDSLCVSFDSKVAIMDSVVYHWTFGDGAVSNLQNPIHCYRDTGKYDVSLLVTNVIDGCRNGSVEPEMIKIFKTPKAVISADPDSCYGDTARFEYLKVKEYSHSRWFAQGNELLSDENTKATYLLKNEISEVGFLVEENGCTCDTLKILIKRKPNFDFIVNESEICLPFPVTLKAIPKDPNLQFTWSTDSLNRIPGDSLVHLFTRSGYYSVTLDAFSKLTGCSDVLTKEQFIHIYPLPIPKFNQNYKVATLEHPDISFSNQSDGAVSYFWDFGDGTTSEEINPEHKYLNIGEYKVVMEAVTDFGCIDTIGSKVKIIPFSFYVPNAFRPDSDIPENRIFIPIREGIDPERYHFQVFNRTGSTVFETKNPEEGWNGNTSNPIDAEPGVYVWIVQYFDIQGYEHIQKGTVMLVR